MSAVQRFHSRLLIYLVFVLVCLRTMIGRMLPGEGTKTSSPKDAQPASPQPLLLLHAGTSGNHPQYALQAVGVFPYVKVVPVSARAVPVPMEVMGMPPEENAALGTNQLLVHRAQSTTGVPDLLAGFVSSSCCSCFGCSCFCGSCSCFDCSSCSCSSCTCA